MHPRSLLPLLILLSLFFAACSGDGLPSKDGSYPLQSRSVTWDGDRYSFSWADSSGALHQAKSKDVRLVQDSQDYLQMQDHKGVLHLQPVEPINVLGRDQGGQFHDSWFPFLAGAALGNVLAGSRTPGYYYPPTNAYGRGDQIDGSITTTAPHPPDYTSVKAPPNSVHPAAGSVSGENSGTGGGNAATNKLGGSGSSPGSGGSGGSSPAVGGQAGGTGSGSAAGGKSGSSSGGSTGSGSAGSKSGAGSSSGSGSRSAPSRSGGGSRHR